ncbi:MAG: universal stress protein [Candidatus Acidiferrales bacterium]
MKSILFPVDFSSSCVGMAPYVKRVATLFAANVSLLHIFDPSAHGFEAFLKQSPKIGEEHQDTVRNRLNSFLTDEFPVSEHQRILAAGEAATQIAHVAKNGFDLVIMPTHAGSFRRTLLGSTTAKVLNVADCPVLTSRHSQTIAPRPLEHRECVCAVNLDANSEKVLRYAHRAATEAGFNLHIVHSIQLTDPVVPLLVEDDEQAPHSGAQLARQRVANLQKRVGSDAPVHVVLGSINAGLIEAARRVEADVLMIGRSPRSGDQGVSSDLNYAIVRDSPCPVMSI